MLSLPDRTLDMATGVQWKGIRKMMPIRDYIVKALNISTRNRLAHFLDLNNSRLSRGTGVQQDWRGLGELMGFNYDEIMVCVSDYLYRSIKKGT